MHLSYVDFEQSFFGSKIFLKDSGRGLLSKTFESISKIQSLDKIMIPTCAGCMALATNAVNFVSCIYYLACYIDIPERIMLNMGILLRVVWDLYSIKIVPKHLQSNHQHGFSK